MLRTLITLALFIAMTAATVSAGPQKKSPNVAPATVQITAPIMPEAQVMLDGKPLLAIKAKVLSFSPEDRANAISTRLTKLVKDPLFSVNSVKVSHSESTSDIVAGDMILMSVTESDAQAEGNMTTIPESYLPESYKRPPFRVSKVDAG